MSLLFSPVIRFSRLLNMDKDELRKVFSELNNKIIMSRKAKIDPHNILILLPHCLQKNTCNYKITGSIHNCKRCGLCDIDRILALQEKYPVNIVVVNGGTLARKMIKEAKPQAIVAIACERDLSSGILDVKQIPVIGILNDRPEGPCFNTCVDIDKIENAIKCFMGEGA
ncbi:MAG: DUF116 domain-containing protein [Bacillota bacterium]